jgi:predicted nucleotide-binding protein
VTEPTNSSSEFRPRVFIGSSVESLAVAEALETNLQYSAYPTLWNRGFFTAGGTSLDAFLRHRGSFDAAVLVCGPDDLTNKRGQEHPQSVTM